LSTNSGELAAKRFRRLSFVTSISGRYIPVLRIALNTDVL
jgi:hypothetical protein